MTANIDRETCKFINSDFAIIRDKNVDRWYLYHVNVNCRFYEKYYGTIKINIDELNERNFRNDLNRLTINFSVLSFLIILLGFISCILYINSNCPLDPGNPANIIAFVSAILLSMLLTPFAISIIDGGPFGIVPPKSIVRSALKEYID